MQLGGNSEEHYESASICYGSTFHPAFERFGSGEVGYDTDYGDDQVWDYYMSEEGGDEGESFYASESEFEANIRPAPLPDSKAELLSLPSQTPLSSRRHQQRQPPPPMYQRSRGHAPFSPYLVKRARPTSSCSTESNYSSVVQRPKRWQQRGPPEPVYSTFKPVEMANAATGTDDDDNDAVPDGASIRLKRNGVFVN